MAQKLKISTCLTKIITGNVHGSIHNIISDNDHGRLVVNYATVLWGTGMIASSSTTSIRRGSQGSVSSVVCFTWYGSTSLQQSSKRRCSPHLSGHNHRADCEWPAMVPPFDNGANAARISPGAVSSAGTDVGRGSLDKTGNRVLHNMCLTWDEWSYP